MGRVSQVIRIGAAVAALGGIVSPSGRLAAQSVNDTTPEPVLSGASAEAVTAVRRLYDREEYGAAVAAADTAMRHGAGSTELQSWRLAALAAHPVGTASPIRTARRMAWMHVRSPWAWMGLAMTTAAVPDSAAVTKEAATKLVALLPNDPTAIAMAARALREGGQLAEAQSVLGNGGGAARTSAPVLVEVASTLAAQASHDPAHATALTDSAIRVYAAARAQDSMSFPASYRAGMLLLQKGDTVGAYPLLRHAASLSESVPAHAAFWRAGLSLTGADAAAAKTAVQDDMARLQQQHPGDADVQAAVAAQKR